MHQRPPADPDRTLDDLLAPAGALARAIEDERLDHGDGGVMGDDGGLQGHGGGQTSDYLDDVFVSAPGSPSTAAGTAGAPEAADTTSADVNRLHHDHSTAGYRDGLTAGKNASIQAGFDEGYAVGAALGAVAGQLLGLVEGLVEAVVSVPGPDGDDVSADDRDSLRLLLVRARSELAVQSIFSPAYFAPDGTWTYEVAVKRENEDMDEDKGEDKDEKEDQDDAQVTIFDVAHAHPLVRNWRTLVDEQMQRRGLRWGGDDDGYGEVGGGDGEKQALAKVLGLTNEGENTQETNIGSAAGDVQVTTSSTGTRAPPSNPSAFDW